MSARKLLRAAGAGALAVTAGLLLRLSGALAPPGEAAAEPPPAPGGVVAHVGERALLASDLSAFLFSRQREAWLRGVDDLIDETIVRREASRLSVGVPREALARAVAEEERARAAQLKEAFGEEVGLAAEVERAYGLSLDAWRREVLGPRIEAQLLLMRIVRLDTRRRPRVHARVIVLADAEHARRVAEKLRAGADFALTAVQESTDATARRGGDLPAVARGDLAWPEVEARLFEASQGELVGPLRVLQDGREAWHLYRVVEHHAAWEGSRAEILARLEADLAESPLARAEFERWRARMRRDFRVEVLAPDGRPLAGAAER